MKRIIVLLTLFLNLQCYSQTLKVQIADETLKVKGNFKLVNNDGQNFITYELQNTYSPDFKKADYLVSTRFDPTTALHKFNDKTLAHLNQKQVGIFSIQGSNAGELKIISIDGRNYLFLSYYNSKNELTENLAYAIDENLNCDTNPTIIENGKFEFILSEDGKQLLLVNQKESLINYSIFDSNLNLLTKSSVDLGYKLTITNHNIKFTAKYIHVLGLNLKSGAKKIANKEINKLFAIDISNNVLTEQNLKTEIENIVQFDMIFNHALNKIMVGGLLSNKQNNDYQSNKRNIIHGIFYYEFDAGLKSVISTQIKAFDKELKGFCSNWNYTLKSLKLINDNTLYFICEQENLQSTEYNNMGEAGALDKSFTIGDLFISSFQINKQNENFWSLRLKRKWSSSGKYSDLKFDSHLSLNNSQSLFILFNSNADILKIGINKQTKDAELNFTEAITVCLEINPERELTIKKVFDERINEKKFKMQTNNLLPLTDDKSLFILDNETEKKIGKLTLE